MESNERSSKTMKRHTLFNFFGYIAAMLCLFALHVFEIIGNLFFYIGIMALTGAYYIFDTWQRIYKEHNHEKR